MKQFGGKVRKADLQRFQTSPNWKGQKFENQIETTMDIKLGDMPHLLKKNFIDTVGRVPDKPLPMMPFDLQNFTSQHHDAFIWYGHSVGLFKISGKIILVDPMFGPDASPIAPFRTKRFSTHTLDILDELPEIDLVLLTHDHYDHLDMESIKRLKGKVKNWWVALGVMRHLEYWGLSAEHIQEFDWWDEKQFDDVKITFTPSRHFSGRGAFDRAKSLWGGWVLKTKEDAYYWSGDGGYGPHFKEIGKQLGPFNWGFMECGQYNEKWHAIHMYPEETIQAAIDAGVKVAVPVHWAGFALAIHTWKDPIKRFYNAAQTLKQTISTPRLGEMVGLNSEHVQTNWWTTLK